MAAGPPDPRRTARRGRRAAATAVAPDGHRHGDAGGGDRAQRRTLFVADGQPLREVAADRHDEKIRALAALPLRSTVVRGALTVGYQAPRTPGHPPNGRCSPPSAELVGQAAERARRFETQHGTAQLLQRSMLPEQPARPAPAAASPPATTRASTATPPVATSTTLSCCPTGALGVVLGDVAGHDVQAAALMGQVRAALRALALSDPRPGRGARAAWTGWWPASAPRPAATNSSSPWCSAWSTPDAGSCTLASAGHPAPLIRRGRPGRRPGRRVSSTCRPARRWASAAGAGRHRAASAPATPCCSTATAWWSGAGRT